MSRVYHFEALSVEVVDGVISGLVGKALDHLGITDNREEYLIIAPLTLIDVDPIRQFRLSVVAESNDSNLFTYLSPSHASIGGYYNVKKDEFQIPHKYSVADIHFRLSGPHIPGLHCDVFNL